MVEAGKLDGYRSVFMTSIVVFELQLLPRGLAPREVHEHEEHHLRQNDCLDILCHLMIYDLLLRV